MKLTKDIYGVPDGEIYPRVIEAGQECPDNLAAYAEGEGAIEKAKPKAKSVK